MLTFIALKGVDGVPIYVNPAHVVACLPGYVGPADMAPKKQCGATLILSTGGSVYVSDTLDEIINRPGIDIDVV